MKGLLSVLVVSLLLLESTGLAAGRRKSLGISQQIGEGMNIGGDWWLYKSSNRMTDQAVDLFVVQGIYPDVSGVKQRPVLKIVCSRGKFKNIYFDPSLAIRHARSMFRHSAPQSQVAFRVDSAKPVNLKWDLSADSKTLFADSWTLHQVLKSQRALIQFDTTRKGTLIAEFQTAGLDGNQFYESCGIREK